jgi:hypothetical protein
MNKSEGKSQKAKIEDGMAPLFDFCLLPFDFL